MTTPARWPRRPIVALIAASLLAAIGPSTAAAAGPTGAATSPSRAFTMDLGTRRDFVAQTNFVQCVGASMQMMINMASPGRDRSAATQRRLQELARATSGPRPDGSIRQGASVMGWSTGLNQLGAGPYRVVGAKTLQGALKMAARAMRRTGRPVGLLVWQGRHAWVMSGFKATADPLTARSFQRDPRDRRGPTLPARLQHLGPEPGTRVGVDAEAGRTPVRPQAVLDALGSGQPVVEGARGPVCPGPPLPGTASEHPPTPLTGPRQPEPPR